MPDERVREVLRVAGASSSTPGAFFIEGDVERVADLLADVMRASDCAYVVSGAEQIRLVTKPRTTCDIRVG